MSSDEVWYFLRGQENVGPFSKSVLQQIYQGGQLTLETLVWREGMAGWEPVSKVPELEIGSPASPEGAGLNPPPSPAEVPATAPAAPAGKLKLKLKTPSSVPAPSSPSSPSPAAAAVPALSPGQVPPPKLKMKEAAPTAPSGGAGSRPPSPSSKAPTTALPSTVPVLEPGRKKSKVVEEEGEESLVVPVWKRLLWFVFSGQFLTPIFLIAGGVIMFLYSSKFPDVLGLYWWVTGFAVYGALYLFRFRAFAGLFRMASLFFLLPPLRLFWGVLSSETPAKMVPVSHWIFLVFCVCYLLTIWIGLHPYFTSALGRFAGFTGIFCLVFMGLVSQEQWVPGPKGEWEQFVKEGSRMRLPGPMVSFMKLPSSWGENVGSLKLDADSDVYLLESVVFKPDENPHGDKEWRMFIKTLDGQLLIARVNRSDEKTVSTSVLNQDCPMIFSKEGLTDPGMDRPHWTKSNGTSIDLSSATLQIMDLDPKTKNLTATLHFQRKAPPPGATDNHHNEIKGDLKATYKVEQVK